MLERFRTEEPLYGGQDPDIDDEESYSESMNAGSTIDGGCETWLNVRKLGD